MLLSFFFFPSLFFLGLVICSFSHRKYIVFFLFYGLKVNLIYIRGNPPFFLLSLCWILILVNVDLQ